MPEPGEHSKPESPSGTTDGQFAIHKIYVKDLSFETPNSPAIFRNEWRPQVDIQLHSEAKRIEPDLYEVVLSVTVTSKLQETTAFLVEVHQAGIFGIAGVPEGHLGPMLSSFCPNLLFPYARETVSDLVARGGFPQFLLAPVNFDALYAKHLEDARKASRQSDPKPEQTSSDSLH
ncbi:MAG: protein-export chaperone SecB [Gammaproteobacteria bacterium]|jgi:preprotein translocase subunit SecB